MRIKPPLLILLVGSLVWLGCEEQMAPETPQADVPSFAKGGPPDECDLKGLPLGDYFSKVEAREVSALVKDLSAACVDGLQDDALSLGFQILTHVDLALSSTSDFDAGGKIVAGVWGAVQYNNGVGAACAECASQFVDWADVAEAMEFGAFGIRSSGSEAVVSTGEYPYIWGVEPSDNGDDSDEWFEEVPLGWVLIYGSPITVPGALEGSDPALTTGFNWYVIAWWAAPTVDTDPLLVGTCVPSTGANVALVSHEPEGGSPSLLPKGPSPSYCTVQASLGDWMVQFASQIVPFWPQPLNASAMVGTSGSGKAREFSPFHEYDVAPYATVTFTPLPPDGYANTELCADPWCTLVEWTTGGGSPIASEETLRFATEANSSSWAEVDLCVAPVYADYSTGTEVCGTTPMQATCDGRASATNPCVGLAVTSFVSDKTGSHRICVNDVEGGDASGLIFDACTPTFNMRP